MVEKTSDVRLDQVVVATASELSAQVPDRIQGLNSRSVAVAAAQKILLVDRFQDLGHAYL